MEILIKKTTKRSVNLVCNGKQYVINLHGVICRKIPTYEGKFWYQISSTEDDLGLTFRQAIDFVESLKIGRDHRGNIYKDGANNA